MHNRNSRILPEYTEIMVTEYGKRLRVARREAKLTQKSLAAKVGVAQGTISELEKIGHGSAYSYQIAMACRVSPQWLATGEGDRKAKHIEQKERAGLSADAVEIAVFFDMLTDKIDRTKAYVAAMAAILKVQAEREAKNDAEPSEEPPPAENPGKPPA